MKRILLLLLICLVFKVGYCQRFEKEMDSLNIDLSTLLDKTHAQRTLILTHYYEWGTRYLDSAYLFSKLDNIRYLATKNNDRELELEAELIEFHYFVYRPYFPKELIISKLEHLNKIAQNEKVLWLEIRAQNMLANYHFTELKEYEKGFEYYERTVHLLKGISPKEFPLKAECLFVVGQAHYHFHDYEQATINFKKALKAHYKRKNNYYYLQSLNNLGLCYRYLNKLDSSERYFNKLHTYAVDNKIRVWEGISSGNLGYNYYIQGENIKAIPLIEIEVEIGKECKDWGVTASALLHLSKIKLENNSIEEARALIKEATQYVGLSKNYAFKAKLFPLLAKIAAYDNKPYLTNVYLDSAFLVTDSLENNRMDLCLYELSRRFN